MRVQLMVKHSECLAADYTQVFRASQRFETVCSKMQ